MTTIGRAAQAEGTTRVKALPKKLGSQEVEGRQVSCAVCQGHGPARAGRWSQTGQGLEDPAQRTGLHLKDTGHHGRLRSGTPWYNLLSRRFSLAGMCKTDGGEVRVLPSGFFHLWQPRGRLTTQRGSKRGFHC